MAGPCSDAVVTNVHHIALDNQLDIAAASLSIEEIKTRDVAGTTNFNAISNTATSKQDRADRQNRYL